MGSIPAGGAINNFMYTPTNNPFVWYQDSVDLGKEHARKFLITHARLLCSTYGFSVFKQFVLNYRITFTPTDKERICREFYKYVIGKTDEYNSDLAMAYNIVTVVKVQKDIETDLVNFMFNRLKHTLLIKYAGLNIPHEIKKRISLETIYDKVLIRKNNICSYS